MKGKKEKLDFLSSTEMVVDSMFVCTFMTDIQYALVSVRGVIIIIIIIVVVVVLFFIIIILGEFGGARFIYFQF